MALTEISTSHSRAAVLQQLISCTKTPQHKTEQLPTNKNQKKERPVEQVNAKSKNQTKWSKTSPRTSLLKLITTSCHLRPTKCSTRCSTEPSCARLRPMWRARRKCWLAKSRTKWRNSSTTSSTGRWKRCELNQLSYKSSRAFMNYSTRSCFWWRRNALQSDLPYPKQKLTIAVVVHSRLAAW